MVKGLHYGDIKFPFRIDTSLCPKAILPASPLNDLGVPIRDRYRTRDVCKILQISPDLFRWRLRHGHYDGIKPGRDAKGRLFTLDQLRTICFLQRIEEFWIASLGNAEGNLPNHQAPGFQTAFSIRCSPLTSGQFIFHASRTPKSPDCSCAFSK